MDRICGICGCTNASVENSIQFFYFPKDPILSEQWVAACGWQHSQIDVTTATICSQHFSEDCYNTDIKIIDSVTCVTKILKGDAVPTLYLQAPDAHFVIKTGDQSCDIKEVVILTIEDDQQNITVEIKNDDFRKQLEPVTVDTNYKIIAEEPLVKYSQVEANNLQKLGTTPLEIEYKIIDDNPAEKYSQMEKSLDLHILNVKNKRMRKMVQVLEKSKKSLHAAYENLCKEYSVIHNQHKQLRAQQIMIENSSITADEEYKMLLKVFSEPQIKILTGKKKIYWSEDDMAVSYTIKQLSNKRCYAFITKTLKIPLPAISSLKRWVYLKESVKKAKTKIKENNSDN